MEVAQGQRFGRLVRQHRARVGLTQEELAEQAELSVRQLVSLEQGKHVPRPGTVRRLADALSLPSDERAEFFAAVPDVQEPPRSGERGRGQERAVDRKPRLRLPVPPTPFVGREGEVAAIVDLLQRDQVRLVTLTGPGGSGKTRLAIEVARRLRGAFRDGVAFIALASVPRAEEVGETLAWALGSGGRGRQPAVDALIDTLEGREMLLVLDNFEHLVEASLLVGELLAACPGLRVLVTSRSVLHLAAEHDYAVPFLAVPASRKRPSLPALIQYDAIALFVQRARAVRCGFALTEENAQAVVEICRRLDGLPLAIELAAAQVRTVPPQSLMEMLEHRLRALTRGPRDASERQRTLRGTLDWSFQLMSKEEQTLLVRLSVFAGSCTLEEAEVVCGLEGQLDVPRGMTGLVEKSLIQREAEDEPRFGMLQTVREYAAEKLAERGEEEQLRRRHAEYFMTANERMVATTPYGTGLGRAWLLPRYADLCAAFDWSGAAGERQYAVRLALALRAAWFLRGTAVEGRRRLEMALAAAEDDADRAELLMAHGIGERYHGDLQRAVRCFEQSARLNRELGDKKALALALSQLGAVLWEAGEPRRTRELWEEELELEREAEAVNLWLILHRRFTAKLHHGCWTNPQQRFTAKLHHLSR